MAKRGVRVGFGLANFRCSMNGKRGKVKERLKRSCSCTITFILLRPNICSLPNPMGWVANCLSGSTLPLLIPWMQSFNDGQGRAHYDLYQGGSTANWLNWKTSLEFDGRSVQSSNGKKKCVFWYTFLDRNGKERISWTFRSKIVSSYYIWI